MENTENAVLGKYSISATTNKEDYTGSTESIFFVIDKKIPLMLEIESIDISPINANSRQFIIDFESINPNTEKIIINQINYSVYFNNFKLLSAKYDKKSKEIKSIEPFTSEMLKSLLEEEGNKEVIRDSQILQRSEIPENIWNSIFVDESLNLKVNGTFSYNPYPDLIEIKNKEEFDFLYTTNKLQ